MTTIYIGADHNGFELKEAIENWLINNNHTVCDLGAHKVNPGDDFPDYVRLVCESVIEEGNKSKGILFCGNGQGMAMAANIIYGVRGIRAAVCWDLKTVRQAREHLDANVLCLGGEYITVPGAEKMVSIFLYTKPLIQVKYLRRISKIQKFMALQSIKAP